METRLMEIIFGSDWTLAQLEAVAVLHGRQIAERTAGRRAFARTIASDGDVVRTAWHLAAQTV